MMCQRPSDEGGEVVLCQVPCQQTAAESGAYDCADLYIGGISDCKHCPAFHQSTPEPNVPRKFYHLFSIEQLQISVLSRPNLWTARPASWWMRCWKQWASFFKELIDTIPFQWEFEQDTDVDIDADIDMHIENREEALKKKRLTSL